MTHCVTPSIVAAGAFVIRFLRLGAIENDHYVYLARAHQMLHGDWPVRDFADPGMPLGYLLSAGAAALFGSTLLTEAVLSVSIFAIGLAVMFALIRRASGSELLALAAVAIVLLFPPRLYNSSKMLVPLVAIAVSWDYADRPTGVRAAALGVSTGVAFLFRHDYAAYIGGATVALLFLLHRGERTTLAVRTITYALAAFALTAPWLLYVQMQQGFHAYLASAMRFSVAEGQRTMNRWARVYYVMTAVPVIALLAAARGTRHLAPAHVVFAGLVLLLSDLVLLRDDPGSRLPDVYATTAVVAAILAGTVMRQRGAHTPLMPILVSTTSVIAAVLLAGATGLLPDRLNVLRRWRLVATRLQEARPEIMPHPERAPLVQYISRCTSGDERLLIGGFAPELSVLSRRAFAGGLPDWIRGYYEDPADVARARDQLAREYVAIAVMIDGGDVFTASWPAIAEDLRSRGLEPYFLQLGDERLELWVEKSGRRDATTGLPCGR